MRLGDRIAKPIPRAFGHGAQCILRLARVAQTLGASWKAAGASADGWQDVLVDGLLKLVAENPISGKA